MTSTPTTTKPIRTVAVTGGTGFVGRYVIRELLACGFQVRALVRDREKAREALTEDLTRVSCIYGDILEEGKAAELVRGADACMHLIGIIRENRSDLKHSQTFRKSHVDSTRAIIHACETVGVKRYLHMSALGVGDETVSEYQLTKWEAERIVVDTKLDWTIFRPGLIHGVGSHLMDIVVGWTSGLVQPWIFLPYFTRGVDDKTMPLSGLKQIDPLVAPVAVEDVARAFVTALSTPASIFEIYNLVGSETLSWPQMMVKIRDIGPGGNRVLKPFGIPAVAASIQARIAKAVGLGKFLPFDEGIPLMAAQDGVAERNKVREHLGLNFTGFSETFPKYAASL